MIVNNQYVSKDGLITCYKSDINRASIVFQYQDFRLFVKFIDLDFGNDKIRDEEYEKVLKELENRHQVRADHGEG